jgi:hypothetical protein
VAVIPPKPARLDRAFIDIYIPPPIELKFSNAEIVVNVPFKFIPRLPPIDVRELSPDKSLNEVPKRERLPPTEVRLSNPVRLIIAPFPDKIRSPPMEVNVPSPAKLFRESFPSIFILSGRVVRPSNPARLTKP